MNETNLPISVELPMGMLWVDVDPEQYMTDTTESDWLDKLEKELKSAFNWDVDFSVCFRSGVVTTQIFDDNGNINDDRYDIIRNIIDNCEVDYVEIEEDILTQILDLEQEQRNDEERNV